MKVELTDKEKMKLRLKQDFKEFKKHGWKKMIVYLIQYFLLLPTLVMVVITENTIEYSILVGIIGTLLHLITQDFIDYLGSRM